MSSYLHVITLLSYSKSIDGSRKALMIDALLQWIMDSKDDNDELVALLNKKRLVSANANYFHSIEFIQAIVDDKVFLDEVLGLLVKDLSIEFDNTQSISICDDLIIQASQRLSKVEGELVLENIEYTPAEPINHAKNIAKLFEQNRFRELNWLCKHPYLAGQQDFVCQEIAKQVYKVARENPTDSLVRFNLFLNRFYIKSDAELKAQLAQVLQQAICFGRDIQPQTRKMLLAALTLYLMQDDCSEDDSLNNLKLLQTLCDDVNDLANVFNDTLKFLINESHLAEFDAFIAIENFYEYLDEINDTTATDEESDSGIFEMDEADDETQSDQEVEEAVVQDQVEIEEQSDLLEHQIIGLLNDSDETLIKYASARYQFNRLTDKELALELEDKYELLQFKLKTSDLEKAFLETFKETEKLPIRERAAKIQALHLAFEYLKNSDDLRTQYKVYQVSMGQDVEKIESEVFYTKTEQVLKDALVNLVSVLKLQVNELFQLQSPVLKFRVKVNELLQLKSSGQTSQEQVDELLQLKFSVLKKLNKLLQLKISGQISPEQEDELLQLESSGLISEEQEEELFQLQLTAQEFHELMQLKSSGQISQEQDDELLQLKSFGLISEEQDDELLQLQLSVLKKVNKLLQLKSFGLISEEQQGEILKLESSLRQFKVKVDELLQLQPAACSNYINLLSQQTIINSSCNYIKLLADKLSDVNLKQSYQIIATFIGKVTPYVELSEIVQVIMATINVLNTVDAAHIAELIELFDVNLYLLDIDLTTEQKDEVAIQISQQLLETTTEGAAREWLNEQNKKVQVYLQDRINKIRNKATTESTIVATDLSESLLIAIKHQKALGAMVRIAEDASEEAEFEEIGSEVVPKELLRQEIQLLEHYILNSIEADQASLALVYHYNKHCGFENEEWVLQACEEAFKEINIKEHAKNEVYSFLLRYFNLGIQSTLETGEYELCKDLLSDLLEAFNRDNGEESVVNIWGNFINTDLVQDIITQATEEAEAALLTAQMFGESTTKIKDVSVYISKALQNFLQCYSDVPLLLELYPLIKESETLSNLHAVARKFSRQEKRTRDLLFINHDGSDNSATESMSDNQSTFSGASNLGSSNASISSSSRSQSPNDSSSFLSGSFFGSSNAFSLTFEALYQSIYQVKTTKDDYSVYNCFAIYFGYLAKQSLGKIDKYKKDRVDDLLNRLLELFSHDYSSVKKFKIDIAEKYADNPSVLEKFFSEGLQKIANDITLVKGIQTIHEDLEKLLYEFAAEAKKHSSTIDGKAFIESRITKHSPYYKIVEQLKDFFQSMEAKFKAALNDSYGLDDIYEEETSLFGSSIRKLKHNFLDMLSKWIVEHQQLLQKFSQSNDVFTVRVLCQELGLVANVYTHEEPYICQATYNEDTSLNASNDDKDAHEKGKQLHIAMTVDQNGEYDLLIRPVHDAAIELLQNYINGNIHYITGGNRRNHLGEAQVLIHRIRSDASLATVDDLLTELNKIKKSMQPGGGYYDVITKAVEKVESSLSRMSSDSLDDDTLSSSSYSYSAGSTASITG